MKFAQEEKKELFRLLTKYADSLMETISTSKYPYENSEERSLYSHTSTLTTHLFTKLKEEGDK